MLLRALPNERQGKVALSERRFREIRRAVGSLAVSTRVWHVLEGIKGVATAPGECGKARSNMNF